MSDRAAEIDLGTAGAPMGRRPQEIADAMADATPPSQRLGQTYRRTARAAPSREGAA
jgi:hypothetical protein